jgi:hypothetical protein
MADKDEMDKRFRDVEGAIEEGIERHKQRLKESQGYGWWKGLAPRQRVLYAFLAVLIVLGGLAAAFGG